MQYSNSQSNLNIINSIYRQIDKSWAEVNEGIKTLTFKCCLTRDEMAKNLSSNSTNRKIESTTQESAMKSTV